MTRSEVRVPHRPPSFAKQRKTKSYSKEPEATEYDFERTTVVVSRSFWNRKVTKRGIGVREDEGT